MTIWSCVVDVLYLLAALAVIVLFAKRGFFDAVFRFGRYIAAAMLTYAFGPMLSHFLYEKWIFNWIATPVAARVEAFLQNTVGSVDIDGVIRAVPAFVRRFADTAELKEKYSAKVNSFGGVAEDFSASVSAPIAGLLSNLLAYVAVFFVSLLLLKLLSVLLNKLFKAPGLNVVNSILGALLGVLAAYLTLVGVTWLLGMLIGLFGSGETLVRFTESTRIFAFFQNSNFLNLFH